MEENVLNVSTNDGNNYQIKVIKIFDLESYPNRVYIAYTFGEYVSNEEVQSYISIINEMDDGTISLEAIIDKEEWLASKAKLEEILLNENN